MDGIKDDSLEGILINDFDDLFNQLDPLQQKHSRRVAFCSQIIAGEAQRVISPVDVKKQCSPEIMYLSGMCHDLGKILLPQNAVEEKCKQHPVLGVRLLEKFWAEIFGDFDDGVKKQTVIEAVRCHHEQPDGKGFPAGVCGKDIPFHAGILSVANKLDGFFIKAKVLNKTKTDEILKYIESKSWTMFFDSIVFILGAAWNDIIDFYIAEHKNCKGEEQ